MANIVVLGKFEAAPEGSLVVDTTSKGGVWAGLSPFTLGPCPLYGGRSSLNMENAWQFAKVYQQHATPDGDHTGAYWEWAEKGWADRWAHRYPMGKGAVPLYSLWDGECLSYVEARRRIYAPLYAQAVVKSRSFLELSALCSTHHGVVALRDFDGYDHDRLGVSLSQVLHDPKRKMGHAFVIKALLTNDPVLLEYGQEPPAEKR